MVTSTHETTIIILSILLVISIIANLGYKIHANNEEEKSNYYREQIITLHHIAELEHNISKECTKKIGIEYNAQLTPLEHILID